MEGEASAAYAVLGLEPDADQAAVERAYKRLIKLHHPDREGGDAVRAAEINRAYRELRGPGEPEELILTADEELSRRSVRMWLEIALLVLIGWAVYAMATGPIGARLGRLATPAAVPHKSVAARADRMDEPLDLNGIDAAVERAGALARGQDKSALLSASRICQQDFRTAPSLSRFDRCAAFDDAVVQLQNRDPAADVGPFSELAVTGRQWSAASQLSSDSLAIDSRLGRIRVQVELTLARPVASGGAADATANAAAD
jgi:hypothetical protein